jgi:hypothetical protein
LEKRLMMSATARACRFRAAALVLAGTALAALSGALPAQPALARDGVNECSIAEIDGEQGRIWRYTIDLQVPEGGHCRVFVKEDKDRKSWNYCWLKGDADNPVSATCDDALDDPDFDYWSAKAVCGDQTFTAYCHRATPLQPSQ